MIFLDGHFSGGATGHGDEPEPVLKELDIISEHLRNFVAIVIDDLRLFGVEAGWPRKHEVLEKIEKQFLPSEWTIDLLNDQILIWRKPALSAVAA